MTMWTRADAFTRCIAAAEARSTTAGALAGLLPPPGDENEEVDTPLDAEVGVGLDGPEARLTLTISMSKLLKLVVADDAEAVPTPDDAAVRVEPGAAAAAVLRSAALTSRTRPAAAVAASP
jgi:hypothetical protein